MKNQEFLAEAQAAAALEALGYKEIKCHQCGTAREALEVQLDDHNLSPEQTFALLSVIKTCDCNFGRRWRKINPPESE